MTTHNDLYPVHEYNKLLSSNWTENPSLVANQARKIIECIFICLLKDHNIEVPDVPQLGKLNKQLKKTPIVIPSQVEIAFGTVWKMGNDGSHYREVDISQSEALTCFSAVYTCVHWYARSYLKRSDVPLTSPEEHIKKINSIKGYRAILSKSIEDGVISLDEAEILYHYRINHNLSLEDIEELHRDMHYVELCRLGLKALVEAEAIEFSQDISSKLLRFFEVTSINQEDVGDILERTSTERIASPAPQPQTNQVTPIHLLGLGVILLTGFYVISNPTDVTSSVTTAPVLPETGNVLGQGICKSANGKIHTSEFSFNIPNLERIHDIKLKADHIEILANIDQSLSIVHVNFEDTQSACLASQIGETPRGRITMGDLNSDGFSDIMVVRSGTLPFGEDSTLDCSNIVSATNTQLLMSTPLLDPNSDIQGSDDLPLCENRGLFKYNNMLGDAWGLETGHGHIVDMDEDGDLDVVLGDQFSLSHADLCSCVDAEELNDECLTNTLKLGEWQKSLNPFNYGRLGIFDDALQRPTDNEYLTLRSDGGVLFGQLDGKPGKDILIINDPIRYESWLFNNSSDGPEWIQQGLHADTHGVTEMYDKIKPSILIDINNDGLDDLVYYQDTHMGLKWIPNQMNLDSNTGLFFQKRKMALFNTNKPMTKFLGRNLTLDTPHQTFFDELCSTEHPDSSATSMVLYLE